MYIICYRRLVTFTKYECYYSFCFLIHIFIFLDVNECLSSVCPENSHCENTLGSYICSCQPGFIKNATQCQGKTKHVKK